MSEVGPLSLMPDQIEEYFGAMFTKLNIRKMATGDCAEMLKSIKSTLLQYLLQCESEDDFVSLCTAFHDAGRNHGILSIMSLLIEALAAFHFTKPGSGDCASSIVERTIHAHVALTISPEAGVNALNMTEAAGE